MAFREKLLQHNGNRAAVWRLRPFRAPAAGAVLALLSAALAPAVDAAQRIVPRIDGFGPYTLGMTAAQARAANKAAKQAACGDIAEGRQCLKVNAAVFEEPAVIYAVLDEAAARVERIVAQLDPQLTQRRAYRCVRLSEKVFALLVVVYGSKYKQSHDENRRPLPAVAWDGEEMGRLVFETRCKTPDQGNPRISVLEYYPDGIKPPPVAEAPQPAPPVAAAPPATLDAAATGAAAPLSLDGQGVAPQRPAAEQPSIALAPPPRAAPIGVVETIPPGAPDTSGALEADAALAALTRELAHAKGKVPPSTQPSGQAAAAPPPAGPDAEATPAPRSSVPKPVATDTGQPATATPTPAGRSDVPVDIAPVADAPAAAVTDIAQPPAEPAGRQPAPPSAAVDPGPVTLPPPVPPAAAAAPAPAPAPVVAAPAPASAPPPDAASGRASTPSAGTLAYAAPGPRQPSAAPWPGRSLRTAIVPPPVSPPFYGEAGAYREPTDLEAPEPFTVPEEEAIGDRAEAADTAPPAPALAMTGGTDASRTIEAEVERRLATAPITYDTLRGSPRRETPAAPTIPTSLLTEARAADGDDEAPRPAGAAPSPAPAVVAAVPALAPARPAADETPPPAKPTPSVTAGRGEEPAGAAARTARGGPTAPVMTGGWRHSAPVPPAKPWRVREDLPESAISGG